MTPRELAIIEAFKSVTFPLYTSRKRFARNMIALAETAPETVLTEKQARYLQQLAYNMRRQMPPELAYPLVDDGSYMASIGIEAADPKPVERPVAKSRTAKKRRQISNQLQLI